MIVCGAPNAALGTAERYAAWFGCNAEALGREGFLGLASYSFSSGLLTTIVTIFVALIGYRLLLGGKVDVAEGTGWAFKIGFMLALLAGWSAFQTVFYDLAISGPVNLSIAFSQAIGIPLDGIYSRLQGVYDSLRLGVGNISPPVLGPDAPRAQPPLPITATVFLTVAVGMVGAAKLATGFLLAVAPIPVMAILFGPGSGLFVGWLRALIAAALAAAGLSITTAMCVIAMETEIARMQSLGVTSLARLDEQAPMAVALMFLLISLGVVWVCVKTSSGLAERVWRSRFFEHARGNTKSVNDMRSYRQGEGMSMVNTPGDTTDIRRTSYARSASVAEAFQRIERRETANNTHSSPAYAAQTSSWRKRDDSSPAKGVTSPSVQRTNKTTSDRRPLGRQHRSSSRRDRIE